MTDKPGYRRPQEGTQPEYLHPAYQSANRRSPSRPLVFLPHSLSEITGPTIGAERVQEKDNDLTAQHKGEPLGERIIIHGRVLDEEGLPVPGILVEIWQANAAGKYDHPENDQDKPLNPNFEGFGRVLVFASGLVKHLLTRIYFDGEPANAADPLLECVPAERRGTLLAKQDASGVYQWNVILQGTDAETVFFDY
ncbi:dioxygenase family protein [Pseudomonas sp. MDT1-16]